VGAGGYDIWWQDWWKKVARLVAKSGCLVLIRSSYRESEVEK